MAETAADPRVYFAAERTLLAWVRTGMTVIGLGFVIARFGLFLVVLGRDTRDFERIAVAAEFGGALALVGGVLTALATVQFTLFVRQLGPSELPQPRLSIRMSQFLATLVSLVGVALSGYLIW